MAAHVWALRPLSRVVLLMTHPAFRQPRHAGWGFDAIGLVGQVHNPDLRTFALIGILAGLTDLLAEG